VEIVTQFDNYATRAGAGGALPGASSPHFSEPGLNANEMKPAWFALDENRR
jgi:hypothetical protein